MTKIANKFITEQLFELSVANCYILTSDNKELYSATLSSHEIAKTVGEPTPIKGGQGGKTILSIPATPEMKLTLVDVSSRRDWEALKMNADVVALGDGETLRIPVMPKIYELKSDTNGLKFTLDKTPVDSTEINVYSYETGDVVKATITGKEVKIATADVTTAGLAVDKTVLVGGYEADVNNVEYMDIALDAAPKSVKAIVECPLYNNEMEVVAYKQYIFYNCQVNGSATFSGQTEMAQNDVTTELTILQPVDRNEVGRVIWVYPEV